MPSLPEDIAAAVDAIGLEPVGIIWGIAHTKWDSAEQRDQFLASIARKGADE